MLSDLTKGQKRALREAAALAHQRDRSMGLEDRDVYYLEARSADLPLIIGGAINSGLLSLDDVALPARDLVADIAARLSEAGRGRRDAGPSTPEDPYDPAAIVSVARIVDEIDFLAEGTALFLNLETGEVTVQTEAAWLDGGQLDEDDEEHAAASGSVRDDPAWMRLLSHHDLDDYEDMKRFAFRAAGPAASRDLSAALHGRGSHRRFREVIHRRGLAREWEAFRAERRAELVRFELQQHGIAFRK